MANSSTSVVSVVASATLPMLGEVVVNRVSISSGVNSPATVTIDCTKGWDAVKEGGEVPNPMETYFTTVSTLQNYLHNRSTNYEDTDVVLSATDTTQGVSIDFSGEYILQSVGFVSGAGGVYLRCGLAGKSALLTGFNGEPYASVNIFKADPGEQGASNWDGGTSTSVTGIMLDILDRAIDRFTKELNRQAPGEAAAAEVQRLIHQANESYIPILKQFLEDNKTNTPLDGYASWDVSVKREVARTLQRIMFGSKNGLDIFTGGQLTYEFGLQFVENAQSLITVGGPMLVSLTKAFDGAPVTQETALVSCNMSFSTGSVLPLRGVFSLSPVSPAPGERGALGLVTSFPMFFPEGIENNLSPRIDQVYPPAWAVLVQQVLHPTSSVSPRVVSSANATSGSEQIMGNMASSYDGMETVMKDWLRLHYLMKSLGSSRGSVMVPLSSDFSAGKVYTVADASGTAFTGYLERVVHNVAVELDSGSASTSLEFTFLRGANFSLGV